jgi:hypothetical protein
MLSNVEPNLTPEGPTTAAANHLTPHPLQALVQVRLFFSPSHIQFHNFVYRLEYFGLAEEYALDNSFSRYRNPSSIPGIEKYDIQFEQSTLSLICDISLQFTGASE